MSIDDFNKVFNSDIFLNIIELSEQKTKGHEGHIEDLINWSLVSKRFFKVCGEMHPIIHADSFAARFDQILQGISDDELKAVIEVFRKCIVVHVLIEKYDVEVSFTLDLSSQRLEFINSDGSTTQDSPSCLSAAWTNAQFKFLQLIRSCNIIGFQETENFRVDSDSGHATNWKQYQTFRFWNDFPKSVQGVMTTFPIDNYSPESGDNSLQLIQRLCNAFHNQKYTDCTIKCGDGNSFGAHRLILAVLEETFEAMFAHSMEEQSSGTIFFPENADVVRTFITYLYDGMNPFSKSDADKIDSVELLALAHRYKMDKLVGMCVVYIVKNADEEQWSELGDLGYHYQNKTLLMFYDFYRYNLERKLPLEMRELFKQLKLPYHSLLAQDVCVQCDAGFGNMLGIRFRENKLQSFCGRNAETRFSWNKIKAFKWTNEGWVGTVPTSCDFKFVRILPNEEVQWEIGDNRRIDEDGYYEICDVRFD